MKDIVIRTGVGLAAIAAIIVPIVLLCMVFGVAGMFFALALIPLSCLAYIIGDVIIENYNER